MLQVMILRDEEPVLLVQVLKPQQGANTLVERVFVNDQNKFPVNLVADFFLYFGFT